MTDTPAPFIRPPEDLKATLLKMLDSVRRDNDITPEDAAQRIFDYDLGLRLAARGGVPFTRNDRRQRAKVFDGHKRQAVNLRRAILDKFISVLEVYTDSSALEGDALAAEQERISDLQQRLPDEFNVAINAGPGDGTNSHARLLNTQAHFLALQHLLSDDTQDIYARTYQKEAPKFTDFGGSNAGFIIDSVAHPASIGLNNGFSLVCGTIDAVMVDFVGAPISALISAELALGLSAPGTVIARRVGGNNGGGGPGPGSGETMH